MKKKHKLQLVALTLTPLVISIPLLIHVVFTKQLLLITKSFYIFTAAALIFLFLPSSKKKIGGQNAKPTFTTPQWILIILAIQVSAISLFLMQNISLYTTVSLPQMSDKLSVYSLSQIIYSFLSNLSLFPWTMMAVIAITFSHLSYNCNSFIPFSMPVPRIISLFTTREIKRIIALYLNGGTKIFLSINIVLLALQISSLQNNNTIPFGILDSIAITALLSALCNNKACQNILNKIEKKQLPQGIHFFASSFPLNLMLLINTPYNPDHTNEISLYNFAS